MTMPPALSMLSARTTAWWDERNPREQRILIVGGAVAAIFLTYVLALHPLATAKARALEDIRISETVTARLRAAGPSLTPGARKASNPADAAASFGLIIRRAEPEGRRTRMTLEDADFETVLKWLEQVEREGSAKIVDVRMERRPTAGAVNADVTLETP